MRDCRQWSMILLFICAAALNAQQGSTQSTQTGASGQNGTRDVGDPGAVPLTPEEQRQKQIRQIDPLSPAVPLASPDSQTQTDLKTRPDSGTQTGSSGQDTAATGGRYRMRSAQSVVPGSIGDTGRQDDAARASDDVTVDENDESLGKYTGPAVLSRSYTINRPMIPQQQRWLPSISLNSSFDSGLISGVNADGTVRNGSIFGAQLRWGLTGRHYWKRDEIGISYIGDFSEYGRNSSFNGSNEILNVDYTHILTPHMSLTLSENASQFSQNYVLQNVSTSPETLANVNLASSPNIQIFDNGVKQLSSQADLTGQITSRLSYNLGGGYFAIVRDSNQLLGNTGEQARADLTYRFTRRTTAGVYYSNTEYAFEHGYGTSAANTLGVIYSYAFGRTTQLRVRVGGTRLESLAYTTVQIDPVLVPLLGQTTAVVDRYSRNYTSDISAQFVKDLSRGRTAIIAYARGISPGNGLFLTSQQESFSARMNMRLTNAYVLSFGASRDTLSTVSQSLGKYQTEGGQVGISRNLGHGFSGSLALNFRYFNVPEIPSLNNDMNVVAGVTWSPTPGTQWPLR